MTWLRLRFIFQSNDALLNTSCGIVRAMLYSCCVFMASSGGVLQLLEHIPAALQDILGPAGSRVPMFYLSPAAPDALATANSCCEYLDTRRREVVLSSGQAPFGHEGLVTSGRLRVLNGTAAGSKGQQQQQWSSEVAEVAAAGPCVAFVSFWSMAAGKLRN